MASSARGSAAPMKASRQGQCGHLDDQGTKARSAKQREILRGCDDGNRALLEITRVASKQIISLATDSRYRLYGILEIAPAQCQRLLKDLNIDGFDLQKSDQVNQYSGGLLLAQMF